MPINYGYQKMFDALKGAACLPEREKAPEKERLFGDFFYKNDLAVLCGPEGSGRSILAMQIADCISRGIAPDGFAMDSPARPVAFLDFEGNHDEFARRYSANGKQPYPFNDNFNMVRFHQKFRGYTGMRKDFLRELNSLLKLYKDGVLIINNLDYWKCFMPESYALAAIKELQANSQLSVLLISGLKGNPAHRPVTLGRAGKLLATMTDSIFAMNFSQKSSDTRYLLQLKTKGGMPAGQTGQVMEFTLGKRHNFTGCHFTGVGTEQEHIAAPATDFERKIIDLSLEQPELRMAEIADLVKTNKTRVDRVLKKFDVNRTSKPETVAAVVTSTFKNTISPPVTEIVEDPDAASHHVEGSDEPSCLSLEPGVRKQPGTVATVVTSTFKNENSNIEILNPKEETSPFTDSRSECTGENDGLPHNSNEPAPLPFDPFRGKLKPSDRPSPTGANEPPEDIAESLKTLDELISSYCKSKPPPKPQNGEPGLTYSQQLKKRLIEARKKKK